MVADTHHRTALPGLTRVSALRELRYLSLHKARAPPGACARPSVWAPPCCTAMPARPCWPGYDRGDARDAHPVQVGVTDAVVRAAGRCDKLTALHIPDSFRVTDEGLAGLARATALVRPARGAPPPRLPQCGERRERDASGMRRSAECSRPVSAGARRRAQEHLDFYGASPRREADITDAGAAALAGLTRLRSLNLAAHAGLTSEGLAFLAACRHLTALDLSSARPGRAPRPRLLL